MVGGVQSSASEAPKQSGRGLPLSRLLQYPGGARSKFRRVLSTLWSKRISVQGRFFLGPGAGGYRLGPHDGLLGLRKDVFESDSTFWGHVSSVGGALEKSCFHDFVTFGCSQGAPPEVSDPGLGAFLARSAVNKKPHKAAFSLGQELAGTVWGLMVAS